MKNYYKILGIKRNASEDEIKQAYRKLALKYHPDRNFGNKSAEEKIKKINEAYEILGDNVKKASYDFDLRKEIENQKEAKRKKEEKNRKRYTPPPVPNPEIVHFNANTSSFFNGDKITLSWYVKYADIIEILPFTGTFENRGVKTWKINNVRSRTLGITLVATNSKTNISTTNTIRLKRKVHTPPLADPSIEYFYANSKFFNSNDVITVSWKVNNVDHIEIEHFGTVNASGTKKLKLTNYNKAALSFDLFAKNTKTGKSIEKSIYCY